MPYAPLTKLSILAAKHMRVLGEPHRLAIVRLLAWRARTVSDLQEELLISQPLVSHHLRRLVEAGLVQKGPRGLYHVFPDQLEVVAEELQGIAKAVGPRAAVRPRRRR